MDPGQVEGDQSEAKEDNKRKQRDFPTSFKVVRMWNAKNQTFELKMVKPDIQSGIPCIKYPTVYAKKESVQDKHALQIMHDLNHRNILSMKMFCASKDTPSSIETFVEPYEGLLWLICDPEQCLITDRIHHVPSPEFQSYLRQIVLGLDFLRQNGLYHGGLSWDSTLYNNHTVKLAGFRSKEPMSEDDAYRYDWLCFLKMLKRISDGVKQVNRSSSDDKWYFCGNLDSLINMLETLVKTLDRTSLSTIAQIVLEHVFFWNKARRVKYFAHKISLKLTDRRFMKRVMKSGIGGKSWDTDCSDDFSMLVSEMNKFRKEQIEKGEAHKDGKADDFSMRV
ncbi:unnamed protein product [Urochloa decumbens]|uniref:Protein kinase domain-containing protein n=1 Tax=Urochloa decumbens TaxID=240449 RepID=A0ABC8VHT7_9POAL